MTDRPPMRVAALVEYLLGQDQNAPVFLRDPDTEWLLPLRVATDKQRTEMLSSENERAVLFAAEYFE